MLISDKKPSPIIYSMHQNPVNGEQNTNNNDYTQINNSQKR